MKKKKRIKLKHLRLEIFRVRKTTKIDPNLRAIRRPTERMRNNILVSLVFAFMRANLLKTLPAKSEREERAPAK